MSRPRPCDVCKNCRKTNQLIFNDHAGERTCTNCGFVAEDHLIQEEEPEYRIFTEEDERTKRRVGAVQSIYEIDTSNPEHQYLKELKKNTKDVLSFYYYEGERVPKLILYAALDIVEKAYRLQKRQKEVYEKCERQTTESSSMSDQMRKKYSHRIVIVVCGCYVGLQTIRKHPNIDLLSDQASHYISQTSSLSFVSPKVSAVLKMLQRLSYKKESTVNSVSHQAPRRNSRSSILRR